MDLVDQKLGESGELKLQFSGAKLQASGEEHLKGIDISLSVVISPKVFLDQLAAAHPGGAAALIKLLEAGMDAASAPAPSA